MMRIGQRIYRSDQVEVVQVERLGMGQVEQEWVECQNVGLGIQVGDSRGNGRV